MGRPISKLYRVSFVDFDAPMTDVFTHRIPPTDNVLYVNPACGGENAHQTVGCIKIARAEEKTGFGDDGHGGDRSDRIRLFEWRDC
jgi:hypothetical protein